MSVRQCAGSVRRVRRSSWVLGLLALLLTVPSVLALARQSAGLERLQAEIPSASVDGAVVPATVLVQDPGVRHPVVVVVHGFAGSAMLMDDLGVSLARAGYAVVLPDLSGHGRNAEPLPLTDGGVGTAGTARLSDDLGATVAWARAQAWADPQRLGLLGHSMGAGAVVRYAVAADDVVATVALSLPSDADVPGGQPAVPRNLLLLVGSAEQSRFTDAALGALRAAYPDGTWGPGYGSPVDGTARSAEQVDRADHITILFSQQTRQLALDWLDQTVGAPSSGSDAGGSRVPWLLLLTVGAAIGFVPLSRLALPERPGPMRATAPARWWAVLLVALGASVAASLAAKVLGPVAARVPLAVGGYVLVWFAVAAAVVALATALVRRGVRGERLAQAGSWREIGASFGLTAYAVVALGLVASVTWTAFALPGDRRLWLLPAELVLIAWFWADDRLVGDRWWLAVLTRLVAVAVLLGSVVLLGAPGFLSLLVPLVAAVLLLLLVYGRAVAARQTLPWSAAMVQGVPLAYLVVTTFPLVS
jgi:dienelactone hydrolase